MEIIAESRYRLVIPRHGRMRVPGVVFATRALIPDPAADRALEQVVNVAELRGIVCDARPALGLRVPDRRGRRDRCRPWRRGLAGRCRVRHRLRGQAAGR